MRPLRELAYWLRVHGRRVDGVTAVQARNGWYTRHRTDLPFPPARVRHTAQPV